MVLAISCLTLLAAIWGDGGVSTWLSSTGISTLLASIGFISLRFRRAYKVQGLRASPSDLLQQQAFFLGPLLPIGIVVLDTLISIVEGTRPLYWNLSKPGYVCVVRLFVSMPNESFPERRHQICRCSPLRHSTLHMLSTNASNLISDSISYHCGRLTLRRMRMGAKRMERCAGAGSTGGWEEPLKPSTVWSPSRL